MSKLARPRLWWSAPLADRDHPDARSAFLTLANIIVVEKDMIAHRAHEDVSFVVGLKRA
jgi:hypothetical protein